MSSHEQHGGPATGTGPGGATPTPSGAEPDLSYEAFEARAKALHGEPPTDEPPVGATGARVTDDAGTAAGAGPSAESAAMVDELRDSAVVAAKGLAGLHLTTTDLAARALGGFVERAGDASGNERVAGLARSQAGLLRRAAGRYTSLGRRLLG